MTTDPAAPAPGNRVGETARFVTIADSGYFPGLVALVNSLRLQGHREPITVLDLGLSSVQRAALEQHCDFVVPSPDVVRHPWLMHPYACALRPADAVIYIDSDIIVTSPLDEIIASASAGRICVFANAPPTRWFAQWEQVFGLRQPPRHQTYVNAGFLAFSPARFPSLASRWWDFCGRLIGEPTVLDTGEFESPTAFASQDALNALLMSEVELGQIEFQPLLAEAQGPVQLHRARVVDRARLQCRLDGHPTTLLHTWSSPKPWEPEAAKKLRRSAYLRCLRRLVVAPDVAVRLPAADAPAWLRPGPRGAVTLWLLTEARRPVRGARARIRSSYASTAAAARVGSG
jgi:hypothetical protein